MAKTAGHVTMLQRSPTYVVSRPEQDALANTLAQNPAGELGLRHPALEEHSAAACTSTTSRARNPRA